MAKEQEQTEKQVPPTTEEYFEIDKNDPKALLDDAQKRLQIKVTPLDRIIVQSYIRMGYITEYEIDDVLVSISERNQKKGKINEAINDFCTSVIGMLLAPLGVKWVEKQSRKLDYATAEDMMKADYKKKLLTEILEND